MTRRSWLLYSLLVALGCESTEQQQPKAPTPLKVYTDIALLRTVVDLPNTLRVCRFVERKLGVDTGLDIGPSDYILHAFVEMNEEAWKEVLGYRPEDALAVKRDFNADVARALFPSALPPAASGKSISIPAVEIKSGSLLGRGRGRRMTRAYRVGEGLYFVLATS